MLALLPMAGLCSLSTCQAEVLRETANHLDSRADDLDGGDTDLGDLISDIVDDW